MELHLIFQRACLSPHTYWRTNQFIQEPLLFTGVVNYISKAEDASMCKHVFKIGHAG